MEKTNPVVVPTNLEAGIGRIIGEVFNLGEKDGTPPSVILKAVCRYFDDWEINSVRMDVVDRLVDDLP